MSHDEARKFQDTKLQTRSSPRLLNLGCGTRFQASWVNVDFVSRGPDVLAHDLRRGVPFEEGRFDLVYHSHVLEHFSLCEGLSFLRECHRVTRVGGILRVAVPNLEEIAANYLLELRRALGGEQGAADNHRWMMIELLDQLSRSECGGQMLKYLRSAPVPNEAFVIDRLGVEAQRMLSGGIYPQLNQLRPAKTSLSQRARTKGRKLWWQFRETCTRKLLGEDYNILLLGRFRSSGEVHLWMYDRYSLGEALLAAGYSEPRVCSARESQFPAWDSFHLDTEPDGTTYKPDSLYMEAVKLS